MAKRDRSGAVSKPLRVVAPTSVVSNWIAEIARFAPSLRVAALTTGRRRQSLAERIAAGETTPYALADEIARAADIEHRSGGETR